MDNRESRRAYESEVRAGKMKLFTSVAEIFQHDTQLDLFQQLADGNTVGARFRDFSFLDRTSFNGLDGFVRKVLPDLMAEVTFVDTMFAPPMISSEPLQIQDISIIRFNLGINEMVHEVFSDNTNTEPFYDYLIGDGPTHIVNFDIGQNPIPYYLDKKKRLLIHEGTLLFEDINPSGFANPSLINDIAQGIRKHQEKYKKRVDLSGHHRLYNILPNSL